MSSIVLRLTENVIHPDSIDENPIQIDPCGYEIYMDVRVQY